MKRNFYGRALTAVLLAALAAIPHFTYPVPADALEPVYEVTDAYRGSVYYERLKQVELTGDYAVDLINVALSQVGYHEGNSVAELDGSNESGGRDYTEYGYYFGMYGNNKGRGHYYAWCAMFVTWCARQAGIPRSVISNAAYATVGSRTYGFNNCPYYDKNGFDPQPGDLIIFLQDETMAQNGHVGIVYRVIGNTVTIVEGNKHNQVRVRTFSKDDPMIQGYGRPKYNNGASGLAPVVECDAERDTSVVSQLWLHTKKSTAVPCYADFFRTEAAGVIAPQDECIISGFYTNGTAAVLVEREKGWQLVYTDAANFVDLAGAAELGESAEAERDIPTLTQPFASAVPSYVVAAAESYTVTGRQANYTQIVFARAFGSANAAWVRSDALPGYLTQTDFVWGDGNGDGTVSARDLAELRRYLAAYDFNTGASVTDICAGADCNADGEINARDVLILRDYISGFDYALGSSSGSIGPQSQR